MIKRKGSILNFIALSMVSASFGFAQPPTDERTTTVTPVPQAIQYCFARMIDENKTLELTVVRQQKTDRKTHYDVSLPNIVDGKKAGYRTERRERTQSVLSIQTSYCELEARTLDAYHPDGKRLSVQEVADQLKLREFRPVILSDTRPDDLMATVLASDCIVIVVPPGDLEFQIRDQPEK